jgi:hypothetical protein
MKQEKVKHKCKNGHTWTTIMVFEDGGLVYVNEEESWCAICNEEGTPAR